MITTITGELCDIVLQTSVDRCLAYVVEFDVATPPRLAETRHVLVVWNLEGEAIAQLLCGAAFTTHTDEY